MKDWFIPYNVPSSKNSKRILRTRSGKPFVSHSLLTSNYIQNTQGYYLAYKIEFLRALKGMNPPYKIGFTFIRDSKRPFDYINAAQIVQDLMVRNGWLEDDNCNFLIPVFLPYIVDKNNTGVKIEIL